MNLFIGSSIIERWKNLPFQDSVNLGISGLTTNQLQNKYSSVPFSHKNVFIYIGSNDIVYKHNIQDILQNITDFILSLSSVVKNIVFIAIIKSPNRTKTQIKQIDFINRKMREFIQSSPKFHFCNCNRALTSIDNFLSHDQTHLSSIGYQRLSNTIVKKFSPFSLN
jgi:lysophospholipase L1-like esterase